VNCLGMLNGHYRVGHGQGLSFSCKCFDVAACMMWLIRLVIAEICVALMTFLFFFLLRLFLNEVSNGLAELEGGMFIERGRTTSAEILPRLGKGQELDLTVSTTVPKAVFWMILDALKKISIEVLSEAAKKAMRLH